MIESQLVEVPSPGNYLQKPIISVACVSNIYIRQIHFMKAGDFNVPHTHNHDHTTLLGNGSVECSVDGNKTIFKAPAMIYIAKDKLHFFTALENDTVAYCIHAIRGPDGDGDNNIISPDSIPNGIDQGIDVTSTTKK